MHATDLFSKITEQLIADIEAGAGEWRMPWHCLASAGTPTNLDGRSYRGINAIWLPLSAAANGLNSNGPTSGIFGTYRSFQRHGCQVRRGSVGTPVLLWKPTTSNTADNTDSSGDDIQPTRRLIARTFTVFAAEQADGADELVARRAAERAAGATDRFVAADEYVARTGAVVIEGGNRAFYQPATDTITVPTRAQFDTLEAFISTRSHEQIHWAGSSNRLARDLTGRFGSDAYAAEELVAELGAAMWCAQMGIGAATRTDHAQYLSGWLAILRADARSLVTVASKAQAAVDYLNALAGFDPNPAAASDDD